MKELEFERKKAKENADDDTEKLLSQEDLTALNDNFWRRYKIVLPPMRDPGDDLVSRVARQMERVASKVVDVMKAKSQMHQAITSKKKSPIPGTDLAVVHSAVEEGKFPEEVRFYLLGLFLYVTALAKAGCKPCDGAPGTEPRGSDSTDYVHVPWDVGLAYYFRAERAVALLPHHQQLSWLAARDPEERAIWVQKSNNREEKTLGQSSNPR